MFTDLWECSLELFASFVRTNPQMLTCYFALLSSINNTQGVSAAFSAPLLGSIPVTHRGISNQVVMCTGYGREGTSPDLIQYHKEQTVVFLMAVGRLRSLCDNLVTKAHYPKETPVGIVERAGCPDQRTIVGNMETIADLAERYNVKPPSTIVVGEVVNVLLTEDDFGMVAEEMEEHHRREGLVVVQSNTI
jgi:uroporphyrin-III C-methyltransferase